MDSTASATGRSLQKGEDVAGDYVVPPRTTGVCMHLSGYEFVAHLAHPFEL